MGTEDVTGLEFLQKGFWMSVKSTHAVDAFLLQPHNEGLNLKIQVFRLCPSSLGTLFFLHS